MAKSQAVPSSTVFRAFLFTDLVGSTDLKRRLGDAAGAEAVALHDELFRSCLDEFEGAEHKDIGDGFLAVFDVPSNAVRCALAFQRRLSELATPEPLQVRIGIHAGEIVLIGEATPAEEERKHVGLAIDTAARVMGLAQGRQALLTRGAFDSARQQLLSAPDGSPLQWLAHGAYLFQGLDDPLEVFEVGIEGLSPLAPPPDSEKARRGITPGEEDTLGWRPAAGLTIPRRENWTLQAQMGEGGYGEVWLAERIKTKEKRVFKFCFDPERVRGLRREVVLFRLLRETLGDRDDIVRILEWQFDKPPYFLESEYTAAGDLAKWSEGKGGIGTISLQTRLELVAQTAVALGAAHSVGVLHKDVKPANILIAEIADRGEPRASLTDFGIGLITNREALEAKGITAAGLTQTLFSSSASSQSGTRLYMAPEVIEGKPATTLSDVYALGVLLYQIVVGDFSRSLAPGWERDISHELLREDIRACVEGLPERRLQNAGELADRIRSLDERRRERDKAAETQRVADLAHRRRRQFTVATVMGISLTIVVGLFGARESKRAATEAGLRTEAETAYAKARQNLDVANRERARAQENYQLARQAVDDSFTQISQSKLLNNPELKPLRRELMESALGYYQSFLEQGTGDSSIRGDQARTYFAVASIQMGLVSPEWIDSMRAGHDILEELLDAEADIAAYGSFAEGSWKATAGQSGTFTAGLSLRPADSYRVYARSIELMERLVKRFPETKGFRSDLAIDYFVMGSLSVSDPVAAFQIYQRSLELFEQLHAEDPDVGDYGYGVGINLNQMGWMLRKSNLDPRRHTDERQEEAIRYFDRSRATYESLVSAFPETTAFREQFAGQCVNHGESLMDARRPHEAIEKYSDAIRIYDQLRHEYPTIPAYAGQYPRFLAFRAAALLGSGETAGGTRELEVALSLMDHHRTVGRIAWYLFMWDIDPERVIQCANRAIELDPEFGNQWRMLGAARYRLGDFAAAVEALTHVMTLAPGRDSRAAFFLAMAQWKLGNRDQARQWRDQAIEWMTADSPDDPDLLLFLSESAELFQSEGP